MAEITIKQIKELREATGIGMKACQKALSEAGGDMELAITNLRKAGMVAAGKKKDRETNEGMIAAVENNDRVAVVEVNAETDFVVKNDRFNEFIQDIASEVAETNPASLEDFLAQKYSKDGEMTIEEYRASIVQTIGENIKISRIMTIPKGADRSVGVYSHLGGKMVVTVEIEGDSGEEALAKDIAMHAAASSPSFLSRETVPADVISNEKDIAKDQVIGKPENIIDKIVDGKMNAFYKDNCLVEQPFIKDEKQSVSDVVASRAKEKNKELKVTNFVRWNVGE
ncbi:MAG: translation elongation factor Ts [Chlamydiota bacterium]|nr:translation elongation factor Ts [Chlamydiota bacterium]